MFSDILNVLETYSPQEVFNEESIADIHLVLSYVAEKWLTVRLDNPSRYAAVIV